MVGTIQQEVDRFNRQVQAASRDLTERQFVLFHKKVHLEALRRVVFKTPVFSGRLRGNWQTTIGIPARGMLDRNSKRGGGVVAAEGAGKLALLQPFSITWITNNLPYGPVVELGLYPKTVKRGSRVPRRRGGARFQVRSSGGFSKQAPRGMVAVSLAELRFIFP